MQLLDEKKIQEWYFGMMRDSFEKQKEQLVLMEIKDGTNDKVLTYIEQMNSSYPVQALLSSEHEDYAYSNAEGFEEVQYEKYSKPFAEVIEDFLQLAKRNVQFVFLSTPEQLPLFRQHHHYLHKATTYRCVAAFPS